MRRCGDKKRYFADRAVPFDLPRYVPERYGEYFGARRESPVLDGRIGAHTPSQIHMIARRAARSARTGGTGEYTVCGARITRHALVYLKSHPLAAIRWLPVDPGAAGARLALGLGLYLLRSRRSATGGRHTKCWCGCGLASGGASPSGCRSAGRRYDTARRTLFHTWCLTRLDEVRLKHWAIRSSGSCQHGHAHMIICSQSPRRHTLSVLALGLLRLRPPHHGRMRLIEFGDCPVALGSRRLGSRRLVRSRQHLCSCLAGGL